MRMQNVKLFPYFPYMGKAVVDTYCMNMLTTDIFLSSKHYTELTNVNVGSFPWVVFAESTAW